MEICDSDRVVHLVASCDVSAAARKDGKWCTTIGIGHSRGTIQMPHSRNISGTTQD